MRMIQNGFSAHFRWSLLLAVSILTNLLAVQMGRFRLAPSVQPVLFACALALAVAYVVAMVTKRIPTRDARYAPRERIVLFALVALDVLLLGFYLLPAHR